MRDQGASQPSDDQCRDLAVVGEELRKLLFHHTDMIGRYLVWSQLMMGVEYRVVQHYFQTVCAEGVCVIFHNVAPERTVHYIIGCSFCVPDGKAAVVFGGEATVGHVCRTRCLGPLIAIEFLWIEYFGGCFGICPVLIHERGDIEVNEHSKAQVYEFLLKLAQRRAAGAGFCA